MTDLIRALALWARPVFGPWPCGRDRARQKVLPTPDRAPLYSGPVPLAPRRGCARPPAPRSLYGLDTLLDGEATALVRPYLVAHEQCQERARQRRRCLALVLAADFGVDLDGHLFGAQGVA